MNLNRISSLSRFAILANAAATAQPDSGLERADILFCNAIEPAGEEGWFPLADAGNWPHPGGMQKVSIQSLQGVANDFNTQWEALKRKFKGVPIFIGHPDNAHFTGQPGHTDTKAYGWVTAMKVVGNALWIKPKWSEDGEKIIANAHYRFFSPNWRVRPMGGGNFEPARLISIGLTNNPNIPGEAIANQKKDTAMKPLPLWLKTILAALGFANEAIAALEGESQTGAPSEAEILAKFKGVHDSANEVATLRTTKSTLDGQLAAANASLANARTESQNNASLFANERAKRVELLVAQGTREGKIPPTETATWANEFKADFEATETKLKTAAVKLPVAGKKHAADDKVLANSRSKTEQITELANAAMPACGNNWDRAFAKVQREHPELFIAEEAGK